MKIRFSHYLLLLLAIEITYSFGQSVTVDTTVYYIEIDNAVREKIQQYNADQVLLVLDIDNTILTSDTDLGSDLWYRWQRGKLDLKPRPDQKLNDNCLFNEAICLLYELGTMSLTDSLLPGFIESWQSSGLTVFALTSRSPECRPATERDLELNGIDLSSNKLRTAESTEIHFDQAGDSNLSYKKGIFMTKGAHKGEMLTDILELSGRSFKSIVVVDDGDANIRNFKESAAKYRAEDILLFYYTRIVSDRLTTNNGTELTPEQAEKLDKDWDELVLTLNSIFPERVGKSCCAKSVCFSIDDLPLVSYGIKDSSYQFAVSSRLISSLAQNQVPAIGFVNEDKLVQDGKLLPWKAGILQSWVETGLDLGNHTYSHPDYNNVSFKEFTDNLVKGESMTKEILAGQGKSFKYFRHPYLHTGNTKEKADSLDEFLAAHGYVTAPVTIDNDDYLFAKAYHVAYQGKDTALMSRIGRDYIGYMEKKLVYYESLSDSLFGRNISQILLIHASLLNADYMDQLIDLYRDHNYFFIGMDQALRDPAFTTPVTVYVNQGISWIDRWALSRGKKGSFFSGDPVTPEYIRELAR